MKKLILILATTGLLASCTQNVAFINGESYDLSRLQSTGVDSIIVAHDAIFTIQDKDGNVAFLSTSDQMIVMKKGMSEGGSIRYYAIR